VEGALAPGRMGFPSKAGRMERSPSARKLAASSLGRLSAAPPAAGGGGRERWRLIVVGRVQGVVYRASCCRQAMALGLGGWVRNRPDGSVELEAEGPPQTLMELLLWCEQGPPAARVTGITTTVIAPTGADWFEVRS